jgi:hypothetical protein
LSDKPQKDKVVSLCGRPIDLTKVAQPPEALEAARAKEQLAHWSPRVKRYIALFQTDDGEFAFCGSMDSPAVTLQWGASLYRFAQDMAHIDLTGEAPSYEEGEIIDGEDDPA